MEYTITPPALALQVNENDSRSLGVHRVDGGEDQQLLHEGVRLDVLDGSVHLDRRVARNDAQTRARRVQQHAVEAAQHLGELAAVVVGDDGVGHAQTVQVRHRRHQTLLLQVVGDQHARVLHQLRDVRRLAAGRAAHVQDALVGLRVERHHGQHRGRRLQHVVTGEVLGRGADRNRRVVDLQADAAPVAQRVQVHAAVDERLREVATTGLQRVGSDDQRSVVLVGLEPLDALLGAEHVEEVLHQLLVVTSGDHHTETPTNRIWHSSCEVGPCTAHD